VDFERDPNGAPDENAYIVTIDGRKAYEVILPGAFCDASCDNVGLACSIDAECGTCSTGGDGCGTNAITGKAINDVTISISWGMWDATTTVENWQTDFDSIVVIDGNEVASRFGYVAVRPFPTNDLDNARLDGDGPPAVGSISATINISGCSVGDEHLCWNPDGDTADRLRFDAQAVEYAAVIPPAFVLGPDAEYASFPGQRMYVQQKNNGDKSAGNGKEIEYCLMSNGGFFDSATYPTACVTKDVGEVKGTADLWSGTAFFANRLALNEWDATQLNAGSGPRLRSDGGCSGANCGVDIYSVTLVHDVNLKALPLPPLLAVDKNGNGRIGMLNFADSTGNYPQLTTGYTQRVPGFDDIYTCNRGGETLGRTTANMDLLIGGDLSGLVGTLNCRAEQGEFGHPPDYIFGKEGVNDLVGLTHDNNLYCFGSSVSAENGRCCHSSCEPTVSATCVSNGGTCEPISHGLCWQGGNDGERCTEHWDTFDDGKRQAFMVCMNAAKPEFGLTPFDDQDAYDCDLCSVNADCSTNTDCATNADCEDVYGLDTSTTFGTCASFKCQGECDGTLCRASIEVDTVAHVVGDNRWGQLDHPVDFALDQSLGVFNSSECPNGLCRTRASNAQLKDFWSRWYDRQKSNQGTWPACDSDNSCPFEMIWLSQPHTQTEGQTYFTVIDGYSGDIAAYTMTLARNDPGSCFFDLNKEFALNIPTIPGSLYDDVVHPSGEGILRELDMVAACFNEGEINGECDTGVCTASSATMISGVTTGAGKGGDACVINSDCATVSCACIF